MARRQASPARKARRSGPARVVGIGASAGGLDALRQLIARVPATTGYALVVLQHLPPSRAGELAKLLAKETSLPVRDPKSGERIAPNTIYVVPPHTSASLHRGTIVLRVAKSGTRPHLPIDTLFDSLAEVCREHAVGVVLSGTGKDGTEGLRAIHKAGGQTFAQEPSTAQFDDMPRSAIAAGVADLVMSPAEIGDELGVLAAVVSRPHPRTTDAGGSTIDRVLEQLREASGIDFTSYKRSTIERRLARRLGQLQLSSLEDYSAYLAKHADEARAVYEDLLIHVTEFFRDGATLDRLVAHVAPEVVRTKAAGEPLRAWVPGCSTGEEVYSLAMLFAEQLGDRPFQLFGTDLSEQAIATARRGHYTESVAESVGPERLQRFFVRDDGGYRVKKELRERCIFVRHDLVTDPPFSKLDVISCRNVLIYLGPPLQKRVIPIFHYSLNQPGYLLLGRAETNRGFEQLFSTVDAEARIYARRPAARTSLTFPGAGQLGRQPWRRANEIVRSSLDVQRDVDHVLLARYAPPCVLINDAFEVVQFRGRTGPYLEHPPGQPQLNLLRMAHDGIAPELTVALERAQRTDQTARREHVIVREAGRDRPVNLEVIPLRGTLDGKRHFLVVFEEAPAAVATPRTRKPPARRDRQEVVHLRQELAATKEYLHSIVTQHLATSEELGLTNEELQSANEELQSSNEELQTAKEELQSTNEELETVNDELHRNNDLLHQTNDDLMNVLASVELAIIIVDKERTVRRFTPKALSVMKLIASDIGRPIADLMPSVAVPDLDAMIAKVIETLELYETEVRHPDGAWYRLQIRPYRTTEHKINGATISFFDITALRAAREHAKAIVETVPTPLAVIDDRQRVATVNHSFVRAFGRPADGAELISVLPVGSSVLRDLVRALIVDGTSFEDRVIEDAGTVLRVGARPMPLLDGERLFLVAIADITELAKLERAREAIEREKTAFLDAVSHELRTPLSAILLWAEALRDLPPADPRRKRAIDTIVDSARLEAQLVDDLLDLALSRTTEPGVELTTLEPAPVVTEALELVRSDANAKRITIDNRVKPVGTIAGDPNRLRQIARALISNAVKFTPANGSVTVELARQDGSIELRVINTGPGIPADVIDRVFEPFVRGDASSTRVAGGLGIGLALVRHFVERHGGTIDVVSPGGDGGTTFTVRLPVRM